MRLLVGYKSNKPMREIYHAANKELTFDLSKALFAISKLK
jgi:hypothetical protein